MSASSPTMQFCFRWFVVQPRPAAACRAPNAVVISTILFSECGCGSALLVRGNEDGLAVQAAGVGVGVHGRGLLQRAAVGDLDA
jgi:hypothetical protein